MPDFSNFEHCRLEAFVPTLAKQIKPTQENATIDSVIDKAPGSF